MFFFQKNLKSKKNQCVCTQFSPQLEKPSPISIVIPNLIVQLFYRSTLCYRSSHRSLLEHIVTGAQICYRSSDLEVHIVTGAQICYRNTDLEVHIVTGAQICYRSSDLQVHIVIGAQIYRCTLLQEPKSVTGAQIYRSTLLQELAFVTGAQIYRCTLLQELKSVTGTPNYRCTLLQELRFTGAHCYRSSDLQVHIEGHNRPVIAQLEISYRSSLFYRSSHRNL